MKTIQVDSDVDIHNIALFQNPASDSNVNALGNIKPIWLHWTMCLDEKANQKREKNIVPYVSTRHAQVSSSWIHMIKLS